MARLVQLVITARVRICEATATADPASYLVTVELCSGFVRSGMKLVIPLDAATTFTVEIIDMHPGPTPSQLLLSLNPFDDKGLFLLKALHLRGDELECYG
jgi:hypothetical protein